jgi:hypothetical protein
MTVENENKIGRWGLPRGVNRNLRPIKLYQSGYDLRIDDPDDHKTFGELGIKIPTLEELSESSYLDEEHKARLRSEIEERQLRERTLSKVTPDERERLELEEFILYLKTQVTDTNTMSGLITYEFEHGGLRKQPELLAKAAPLDPDFMNPLLTAIQKRPARRAKAERAIEHILLQRRSGEHPQRGG